MDVNIIPGKEGSKGMVDGEDWSHDECMLALWAYSVLDRNRDIVKTEVYQEVARLTGRKVSSVRIKLNNVAECDPRDRTEKPVPPWERRQNLLAELYVEYGTDHEALDQFHRKFSYLHDFVTAGGTTTGSAMEGSFIIEGEEQEGLTRRKKRSDRLVSEARTAFRNASPDHKLRCSVCDVTFDGFSTREIIQIHHLQPISEMKVSTRKSLKEALALVAPVCPTCHRILHSGDTLLTIEEGREIISRIHRGEFH